MNKGCCVQDRECLPLITPDSTPVYMGVRGFLLNLKQIDTPDVDILIWHRFWHLGNHDGCCPQDRECLPFMCTWFHSCFVKELLNPKLLFFLLTFYFLVCFKFVLSLGICTFCLSHGYSTLILIRSIVKYNLYLYSNDLELFRFGIWFSLSI